MAAVSQQHKWVFRVLLPLALLLFVTVWWRTAWLSDDAGITLRVVLNFVNGLGPNFNIDERVQVYTHPLWFLLLSAAVTVSGELYYTLLTVSLCCSLVALLLVLSPLRGQPLVLAGAACVLLMSPAFVDYASSGLENPLGYLLIALFAVTLLRGHLGSSWVRCCLLLSAAGLVLNRLDCALLALPALLLAVWRSGDYLRWTWLAFLCGIPLLAWFGFALVYYGSPFPNTAFAKLSAGLDPVAVWSQGLRYLQDSVQRDYVTLPFIVLAVAVGMIVGDWRLRGLVAGVAAYLFYTVSIGGDFMAGRFLALPMLVAVIVLSRVFKGVTSAGLAIVAGLLSVAAPQTSWLSGADFGAGEVSPYGIADERAFYYQATGLNSGSPPAIVPGLQRLQWRYAPQARVRNSYTLGLVGLQEGPAVHVFDPLGLADPLLSRLPQGYGDNWRPGHYQRRVPRGYEASLFEDENLVGDPLLAALYDDVRLVTRGPLWTRQRWAAIWRLATGARKMREIGDAVPADSFVPAPPHYQRQGL